MSDLSGTPVSFCEDETVVLSSRFCPPREVKSNVNPLDNTSDEEAKRIAHEQVFGGPITEKPKEQGSSKLKEIANELLCEDGFISDLMRYTIENAPRPQPVLSLAGALALQSALIGRKVKGLRGCRSNLQLIGVCPSGRGKDYAQEINDAIISQSDNASISGAKTFTSDSAVYSALSDNPSLFWQCDEFGKFLETTKSRNASTGLSSVIPALMMLYTSANRHDFTAKAYSDVRNNVAINQPCLVLYGISTPRAFFESLSVASVDDGFLGRCLVFNTDDNPELSFDEPGPIPENLIDTARYWRNFAAGGGNLSALNPEPASVPITDEAMTMFKSFEKRCHKMQSGLDRGAPLWARVSQKAAQVALSLACGFDHLNPKIDKRAAKYAIAIVDECTKYMMLAAYDWIADNQIERDHQKILRAIKASENGLTRSEFFKAVPSIAKRDRDAILETLVESGLVIPVESMNGKAKIIAYKAATF